MQEPYQQDLANQLGPQSCAGDRKVSGEALAGAVGEEAEAAVLAGVVEVAMPAGADALFGGGGIDGVEGGFQLGAGLFGLVGLAGAQEFDLVKEHLGEHAGHGHCSFVGHLMILSFLHV